MILFWMAAAALAGGAALLVMLFASRAAPGAQNPTVALHRRQLLEIDALAERGLIGEADQAAVRAEAGRRLLSSAALAEAPERGGTRLSRLIAAGCAVGAATGALVLYLLIGAPGDPDQPYRARVAAWKGSDPASLDAPRMAAVLKTMAADRPNDPEVWRFLGRAQLAAGDAYGAQRSIARAAQLAPGGAEDQLVLAQAMLASSDGKPSPEAAAALRRAIALDPKNLAARFILGRTQMLAGDRAGGLGLWRSMLADLASGDPRRGELEGEIARIGAGGPIDAPPTPSTPVPSTDGPQMAEAGGADPSAFIRGMVARQAASLAAHPDDAEGWARLIRSYGVLHDAAAQADALAKARRQFVGKPLALKLIEDEAKAHPA